MCRVIFGKSMSIEVQQGPLEALLATRQDECISRRATVSHGQQTLLRASTMRKCDCPLLTQLTVAILKPWFPLGLRIVTYCQVTTTMD